ncbi:Heme exporter protein CcmA [Candidatus Zixiibacteriota bacterium]|nr:Heme exporter protein CcmA [candidate division Zixibacteria bacterium]
MIRLEVQNLAKRFGARKVFSDINFTLETGQSIAVTGPNGSGKSTLLRLLIGFNYPTRGKVIFSEDGRVLEFDSLRRRLALVSPYLALYGSLTARENLRFFAHVNGDRITDERIESTLTAVGLGGRGDDFVAGYSSGMLQRLKYAVAVLKNPAVFMIDEPTSNLDDAGKKIVFDLIEARRREAIIIVATNEKEEYGLAERLCQLGG